MEKVSAILSSVVPLPSGSLRKLLDIAFVREYPKGYLLFREGGNQITALFIICKKVFAGECRNLPMIK